MHHPTAAMRTLKFFPTSESIVSGTICHSALLTFISLQSVLALLKHDASDADLRKLLLDQLSDFLSERE